MHDHRAFYRTEDGRADYEFLFRELLSGSWRAYVLRQPSYRGRGTSAAETHRLRDWRGRYICWTGRLATLNQAKAVAAMWADRTQRYIASGRF